MLHTCNMLHVKGLLDNYNSLEFSMTQSSPSHYSSPFAGAIVDNIYQKLLHIILIIY